MSFRIWLWLGLAFLGLWWCKEVFQRLPDDIRAFKENRNGVERLGLALIWAITALILVGLAGFAGYVVLSLTRVFD